MNEKLETYQVTQYGEYACSCCKKPLIGKCLAVADETDDEGREWRTLHIECYDHVTEEYDKLLVDDKINPYKSLEEYIYTNYPVNSYVE